MKQKNGKIDLIILMAGEGKRMMPLTNDRPKALLSTGGDTSIFSSILQAFEEVPSVDRIIPVIGHGHKKVEEKFRKLDTPFEVIKAYNPAYKISGPLVSLKFGLAVSENPNVIIVNGDTLLKRDITKVLWDWICSASSEKGRSALCVSKTENLTPDDMKVLGEGTVLHRVSKNLTPKEGDEILKSAGVFCVIGEKGKEKLTGIVEDELRHGSGAEKSYHWHNLVNKMGETSKVDLVYTSPDSWEEFDTVKELTGYFPQSFIPVTGDLK